MANVTVPELGEGIEKATLTFWYFKEGDRVKENDDLAEVTTDKAAFNIPAPCNGILKQRLNQEGDSVKIGTIIAVIEDAGS